MQDNAFSAPTEVRFTWNIHGVLHRFVLPQVMGILNVTPDSFFDGGKYTRKETWQRRCEELHEEGACWIDVGGYSTRPGAGKVSVEEEIERICAPVEWIAGQFPGMLISIDTFRSSVAQAAVKAGAHAVNDVSGGGLDPEMHATCAQLGVPYFLMHMRGTPETMQQQTHYDDVVTDVVHELSARLNEARLNGIADICIDPGIGFAKTARQNFKLLTQLGRIKRHFGLPILIGISRKSFLYKSLGTAAHDALLATSAMHLQGLIQGIDFLRVHDVREARQMVQLWQNLAAELNRE